MKASRTFGWVQNPSDFDKLRDVVAVFAYGSYMHKKLVRGELEALVQDKALLNEMLEALSAPEGIAASYTLMKGKGKPSKGKRRDALCTGIAQASIVTQQGRPYSDDWTTDGFLRWAVSIGFLGYNHHDDTLFITPLGEDFVKSEEGAERQDVLTTALLAYPPTTRVMTLLNDAGEESLTKFEIGSRLGGLGEPGFTSIPQDLYVQALASAHTKEEQKNLRANTEGSSDKYARMICSWLEKLGLIQSIKKAITVSVGDKSYTEPNMQSYKLSLKGIKALNRLLGKSSHKKVPKIVYWHMLATKGQDRDYKRTRRAYIIETLLKKRASLESLCVALKDNGIIESVDSVAEDLHIIEAMGITVQRYSNGEYKCPDDIVKLEIPVEDKIVTKSSILELKELVRPKLLHIDHKYLLLIEQAYTSQSNRDLEILTLDLLVNELNFEGLHLGGSRKPDGIAYYLSQYGIILDTKAYKDGYNLPIKDADEMTRYIEENNQRDSKRNANKWWKHFENDINSFYYLFVSSKFISQYKDKLDNIYHRTNTKGAAINVINLLYLAESLKAQSREYSQIPQLMNNDEIVICL